MTCKQTVAGSAEGIPDDFVSMASFGTRQSGSRGTDEYEWLLDAYQTGRIDAVKVMRTPRDKAGPVFVNARQAALLIEEKRRGAGLVAATAAAIVADPNAITVARALERIAYALECIREAMPQPREAQWNDG